MKEVWKYKKLSFTKRILLSLGSFPIILFWILGMIYPAEFRNGWRVHSFLIIALIIYLIVFRYISLRGKRYLFNSTQQLLHNRLLFMPLYPIFYVWFIEDRIFKERNKISNQ